MAEQTDNSSDANTGECQFPPNSERVEYKDLDHAQKEIEDILQTMKQEPTGMGIHHLGRDGIYRSLTADRDVVDAFALSPPLIKALMDRHPYFKEAEKVFHGVDGTKTPKEQWYNPSPEILPPPLEEKHRERSEEKLEENRRRYYERRKKIESGEMTRRAVCLMSDYDLGPGAGKRKPEEATNRE